MTSVRWGVAMVEDAEGGTAPEPGDGFVRPLQPYRNAVVTLGSMVGMTVVFAWVPWGNLDAGRKVVVGITFVVGLVGAAALVWWQVWAYREKAMSGPARLRGLLLAVYLAVLFFAIAFYTLATSAPDEFVGLHTRVDAIYFTVTVLSTVGFGDIHAAGQAARIMVSLQIAFNLLVISLGLGAARGMFVQQRR